MDKTKILENISKKGKVPVADLEKEFEEIFNGLPPSDDREKHALKELNNKHAGAGESRTEDVEVIVLGLRQLTDFNKNKIIDALKKFNDDKVAVLKSGEVKMFPIDKDNPEGEQVPKVMDLQETFEYEGKDVKNPTFGQPLGNKWNRNTLVFARKPGDKEWVTTSFALRNAHATDFKREDMFLPLTINCLGTIKDGLKSGQDTKYIPFDEKINMSQLIAAVCGDHIQELGDVFAYAEQQDPKDYERFVVTSGTVQTLYPPKEEGNSYNGGIDDITTDHLETIFVDEIIGIPEKKKDYTFICQTSIKDKKDKEKKPTGEKQVILNVMGFYP